MTKSIKIHLLDYSPQSFKVCSDEGLKERIGRIVKPNAYPRPSYVGHLFRVMLDDPMNDVRDKFRYHETLSDAVAAIEAKLNELEELPDDKEVLYPGAKLWDYEGHWSSTSSNYIGTDEHYKQICRPFKNPTTYCLGTSIAHGCDVAGYTEAAIYLTSRNQTEQGFVIRYGFERGEPVSRVRIEDAPKGLFIRT